MISKCRTENLTAAKWFLLRHSYPSNGRPQVSASLASTPWGPVAIWFSTTSFHTYIFQDAAKTVLCCGPLYPSTIVQGDGHQQDILLGPLAISGRMAGYGRVVVHSGQCRCSASRIFQTRNAHREASGQMGSFIFNSLKNDCEMQQDGSCYTPIYTNKYPPFGSFVQISGNYSCWTNQTATPLAQQHQTQRNPLHKDSKGH